MDPHAAWAELAAFATEYADGCPHCPARECPHDEDLFRISELITALRKRELRAAPTA